MPFLKISPLMTLPTDSELTIAKEAKVTTNDDRSGAESEAAKFTPSGSSSEGRA